MDIEQRLLYAGKAIDFYESNETFPPEDIIDNPEQELYSVRISLHDLPKPASEELETDAKKRNIYTLSDGRKVVLREPHPNRSSISGDATVGTLVKAHIQTPNTHENPQDWYNIFFPKETPEIVYVERDPPVLEKFK